MNQQKRKLLLLLLISVISMNFSFAQSNVNLKMRALFFLDYFTSINIIEDNDGFRACFEDSITHLPNLLLQQNKLAEDLSLDAFVLKYNNFVYTKGNSPIALAAIPYAISIDTLTAQLLHLTIDANLILHTVNADKLPLADTLDVTFDLNYYCASKVFKIKSIIQHKKRGKYLIIKAIRKRNFLDGFKKASDTTVQKLVNYDLLINGIQQQTDTNGVVYIKDIALKGNKKINISTANYLDFGGEKYSENKLRRIYARAALNSTQAIFFRKSSFFLEFNVGYNSFLGSNPIQSSNNSIENINQKITTNGIGFGIYMFNKNKWDLGLVLGIASYYADNASFLKSYAEHFNSVDPEGANYVRFMDINEINEFQHLTMNTLNAKINFGYKLSLKTKLNIGFKLAKNTKGSLTRETTADALYSGLYEDFFNVRISENGIYDFGKFQLVDTSTMAMNKNISFFGLEIGLEQRISKRMSVNFGMEFLNSSSPFIQPSNNSLSIKNDHIASLLSIGNFEHFAAFSTFQLTLKYKL